MGFGKERNACDLGNSSMGDWAPVWENASKEMFDGMMISLVIPLRMPSEDSFKGSGWVSGEL
jgi:hypothetical protein